ncbi:MAG TPA: RNA polymerase sigma factor [Candidatus Paceibacterota bacterium]|jgi:RNA polymerase sigma-70 factor (ECF subfamily)|nr:RNA polymerase sigma factor [Candidatus Paceibacterota bacterium]
MEDLQHTFEAAFEAYSDELFRHASIRLSDRERAMELTQETFMKVWVYAQKGGDDIRDLRPFLYRTLRNLIIDEYRKHKAVSLEAMAERHDSDVEDFLTPDESNTLEAAVGRFEGTQALKALEQLAEPYREAVVMRYVDGLSPQEIAEAIEVSENVVSVRVHRGLKKLKAMLDEQH